MLRSPDTIAEDEPVFRSELLVLVTAPELPASTAWVWYA